MPWTTKDVGRFTKTAQSARRKRQWVRVANGALARCMADGGSLTRCEAAAIRQANGVLKKQMARNERIAMDPTLFFANAEMAGASREEILHGVVHLVRPLKIVRPMVLNGLGDGPKGQLLPAEELRRCPVAAWNAVPLTLGHPFTANAEDGTKVYASANSPGMYQRFAVGRVFNAHFDDAGRVAAEAWLDVDTATLLGTPGEKLIELFRGNGTAEVSSAYHFRMDETAGQHEGLTYNAIQRDIHPDHVAVLMDSVGACSNEDGCGLGVNESTVTKLIHSMQQFFGKQCACQTEAELDDSASLTGNTDKESEPMDPITSLDALYACPDIDEAVKTQVRDSIAFHQAETKKVAEAREAKVIELAANKACDFTLEELRTMSDPMLAKVEKLATTPQKTSFRGNAGAESMLSDNAADDDFTWVGPKDTEG